jgi:hypothetical protein
MPRKKTPETPPPDDLSPEQKKRLGKRIMASSDPAMRKYRDQVKLKRIVIKCLNHFHEKHLRTGRGKCDWERTVWNWIVNQIDFDDESGQVEKPQFNLAERSVSGNVISLEEIFKAKEGG